MSETGNCPKCGSPPKPFLDDWWTCETFRETSGNAIVQKGEILQGVMCEFICELRASLADALRQRDEEHKACEELLAAWQRNCDGIARRLQAAEEREAKLRERISYQIKHCEGWAYGRLEKHMRIIIGDLKALLAPAPEVTDER